MSKHTDDKYYEDFDENSDEKYEWQERNKQHRVDNSADVIGFADIGGIGQMVYHTFRFREYEYEEGSDGRNYLRALTDENHEVDIDRDAGLTGTDIFKKLYTLAMRMNSYEEKLSVHELMIEFCTQVTHPYDIDGIYAEITDPGFDWKTDHCWINRETVFSPEDFMNDLRRFYSCARFYFALKDICRAYEEHLDQLSKEGRCFDGLPYFERFKYAELFREIPKTVMPVSPKDLLAEMEAENAKQKAESEEKNGGFVEEPFDHIEELQDRLIDSIPDFRMRLKRNPKNGEIKMAADVHSVFDIAFYTLANMIADFGPVEQGGRERDITKGTLVVCPSCGECFTRRHNRQQYCDKPECQNAHNAARQRKYREKKKLEKLRGKIR